MESNILSVFALCTIHIINYDGYNCSAFPYKNILQSSDSQPIPFIFSNNIIGNNNSSLKYKPFKSHLSYCGKEFLTSSGDSLTIIFSQSKPLQPKFILLEIYQILLALGRHKEQSKYVFLEIDNPGGGDKQTNTFWHGNKRLVTLSTIISRLQVKSLFFKLTKNSLYYICLICAQVNLLRIHPNYHGTSSPNDLINQLDHVQVNFRGNYVYMLTPVDDNSFTTGTCSFYKQKFSTPPILCTLTLLQQKLNFTLTFNKLALPQSKIYIGLIVRSHADRTLNQFMAAEEEPVELNWINYGIQFEHFETIIFSQVDYSPTAYALFSPFDKWTWTFFFISFSGIIIFLTYQQRRYQLFDILLWAVSTFFEQTDSSLTNKIFRNWKTVPLFFAWIEAMYVLNSTYQASFFACLTTIHPPNLPSTLEALISTRTDIPLFTSGCDGSNLIHSCRSSLRDVIIPDLLHGIHPQDNFFNFLTNLRNKTIPLGGISGYENVRYISNNKSSRGISLITKNTFALLSSGVHLREFVSGMQLLNPSKTTLIISKLENDVNPFIKRTPWMATGSSSFSIAFSKGLSSFVEIGVYERWNKFSEIGLKVEQIDKVDSKLKNNSSNALSNLHAKFLLEDETHKISSLSRKTAKLSIEILLVPLEIMLVLFMVSALALVLEFWFCYKLLHDGLFS
jgi:hypothetical protein